jgi:hypothetical protein
MKAIDRVMVARAKEGSIFIDKCSLARGVGRSRDRRHWLSARALVLNSGSEDLWLSATCAVFDGGRRSHETNVRRVNSFLVVDGKDET